jgi:hypothetical protein
MSKYKLQKLGGVLLLWVFVFFAFFGISEFWCDVDPTSCRMSNVSKYIQAFLFSVVGLASILNLYEIKRKNKCETDNEENSHSVKRRTKKGDKDN